MELRFQTKFLWLPCFLSFFFSPPSLPRMFCWVRTTRSDPREMLSPLLQPLCDCQKWSVMDLLSVYGRPTLLEEGKTAAGWLSEAGSVVAGLGIDFLPTVVWYFSCWKSRNAFPNGWPPVGLLILANSWSLCWWAVWFPKPFCHKCVLSVVCVRWHGMLQTPRGAWNAGGAS